MRLKDVHNGRRCCTSPFCVFSQGCHFFIYPYRGVLAGNRIVKWRAGASNISITQYFDDFLYKFHWFILPAYSATGFRPCWVVYTT
jgi:hypothetical protein